MKRIQAILAGALLIVTASLYSQDAIYYDRTIPFGTHSIRVFERYNTNNNQIELVSGTITNEPHEPALAIWWDGGDRAYAAAALWNEADAFVQIYEFDANQGTVIRSDIFTVDYVTGNKPLVRISENHFHFNNFFIDFEEFRIEEIADGNVVFDDENSRFINLSHEIRLIDYPGLEEQTISLPSSINSTSMNLIGYLGDDELLAQWFNILGPSWTSYYIKINSEHYEVAYDFDFTSVDSNILSQQAETYVAQRPNKLVEVDRSTKEVEQILHSGTIMSTFAGLGVFGIISQLSIDPSNTNIRTYEFQIFQDTDQTKTTRQLTLDLSADFPSRLLRGQGASLPANSDFILNEDGTELYVQGDTSNVLIDVVTGDRINLSDIISFEPNSDYRSEFLSVSQRDQGTLLSLRSFDRLEPNSGTYDLISSTYTRQFSTVRDLKIWWDGGDIVYAVNSIESSRIEDPDFLEIYLIDTETGMVLDTRAFEIDAPVELYPLVKIEENIFHINNYLVNFDDLSIQYIARGYVVHDKERNRFINANPFESQGVDINILDYPSLSPVFSTVNVPEFRTSSYYHYLYYVGDGLAYYGGVLNRDEFVEYFKVNDDSVTSFTTIPNTEYDDIILNTREDTYIAERNDSIIEVNRETGAVEQTLISDQAINHHFTGGNIFGFVSGVSVQNPDDPNKQGSNLYIFQESDLSFRSEQLNIDFSTSIPFNNFLRGTGPFLPGVSDFVVNRSETTIYVQGYHSLVAIDIETGNRRTLVENLSVDAEGIGRAIPLLNEGAQPANAQQIRNHLNGKAPLNLLDFDADLNRDGAVDSADAVGVE